MGDLWMPNSNKIIAMNDSRWIYHSQLVTSTQSCNIADGAQATQPTTLTDECTTTNLDSVKIERKDIDPYGDGYGPPPSGSDVYPGGAPDPAASLGYFAMGAYAPVGPPPPGMLGDPLNEQIKRDKEAIYNHPLFPLLSCLFEKCELATCTPRDQNRESGTSSTNDVCSSASFKDDLTDFTKMIQSEKPYYVPNPEVDSLMLQAIQVLRFHLLELEKVHELCDNFCHRYVTCLKGKMPMDIVGDERASSSQPSVSPSTTAPSTSPSMGTPMSSQYPAPYEPQSVPLPENTNAMSASHEGFHPSVHDLSGASSSAQHSSSTPDNHPLVLGGAPPLTAGGTQASIPLTAVSSPSGSSSAGGQRLDSTPHSVETPNQLLNTQQTSVDNISDAGDESLSMCGSLNEDGGRESVLSDGQTTTNGSKRKVPKVFSKEAITKFRAWLFQNLTHPYPSEDQKKQLAHETGLTILQVNNWFINARRRIVQPMIDQSNRAGRPNGVNVFKNRRRKSSGQSPGPSPDLLGVTHNYSPDNGQLAAAAGYPAQAMFPGNPYAAGMGHPAFPNPAALTGHMFMPGPMSHMMAPYNAAQTQMGANVWMESLMPGHMSMDA
uniref:Homeobox protein unc-62 n=2 Tax=Ascarididae TaxID=6250 RepID=A0A915C6N1_PARUN